MKNKKIEEGEEACRDSLTSDQLKKIFSFPFKVQSLKTSDMYNVSLLLFLDISQE